jgi:hypothetical protein
MKYISTKQFRANLSKYCQDADLEDIIIDRPGGRMLRLSAVPEADTAQLREMLGKPEGFPEPEKTVD